MTIATLAFCIIVPAVIVLLVWGFADFVDAAGGRTVTLLAHDAHVNEVSAAIDNWDLSDTNWAGLNG